MQSFVSRSGKYAILLSILLVLSVTLMAMPVEAQQPQPVLAEDVCGPLPSGVTPKYTFATKAYMSFRPNPVGVGQPVLVNTWTSPGLYHAFLMMNEKVTIVDPDGNVFLTKTFNSYYGDATYWFEFTPDKPGVWKLKFENPGTYIPEGLYVDSPTGQAFMAQKTYWLNASVYYGPSSTDWMELTVQEKMVYSWPASPLPTDYWARPINPVNREWWEIGGNFPWTGVIYYPNGRRLYSGTVSTFGGGVSGYKYHAYVKGPESAHIVWKRQGALAGIVGGEQTYYYTLSGSPGTPSIIFMGRCYQSVAKNVDGKTTYFLQCYDLRTGEVYWEVKLPTTTTYFFGTPMTTAVAPQAILYEVSTPEPVPGAAAMKSMTITLVTISGGRLIKWSPWNGLVSLNVSLASGISSGVIYNNDLVLSVQDRGAGKEPRYCLINWTMAGSSSNFATRVRGNVSWPVSGITLVDYEANVALYNVIWNNPPGPQWCIGWMATAIDLKTGEILWTHSTNDTISENMFAPSTAIANHGKFAFACQHRHWVCFNVRTGTKLWESDLAAYPWGNWWPYNTASYDFNQSKSAIITSTYEGVYAIDWDTGDIIWHFTDPKAVPYENPYTTDNCTAAATPFFTGVLIADGKVYAYNGEHTQSQPYARDWKMYCLNATTGELIWYTWNPMVPGAVADGYLTAGNPYDGYMYVFGKGKSQTSVTASPKTVSKGSQILIEGSVLDMSPAQPGTPCVAKESMSTWMAYLHLQMPIDGIWHNETIKGVPVMLTAIAGDGSYIDIGTVVTDGYSGTFGVAWTPPKEGTYKILASFNGDDSYGSSSATTWITVGPPPEEIEIPEYPTPTDYTPMLTALAIAIIVVAILVIYDIITVRKLRK
jgi:outer membrane protein assembly factor BamB